MLEPISDFFGSSAKSLLGCLPSKPEGRRYMTDRGAD